MNAEPDDEHWGDHPAFGFPVRHRGRVENCPAPECSEKQPIVVPENWGAYCPHGEHIVVHDPEMLTGFGEPLGRVVDPWPCTRCTRCEFEASEAQRMAEEEDALLDLFRRRFD